MRVDDNAVELDARERRHFSEVGGTCGAIAKLAKPGGDLQKLCQSIHSGLLTLLAKGEAIALEEPVAGNVGQKAAS